MHEARRAELFDLLGQLPPWDLKISVDESSRESHQWYDKEKLVLSFNGVEPVPAYLLLPKNMKEPAPAVLYHHAHGRRYDIGKEELIQGRPALQSPPYGEVLTKKGIAVFCIDNWVFGERSGKSESSVFKKMLWYGQTMLGMMLYDSIRALDYLISRPEIDETRIGTFGMSMGSTLAWWTAALDPRIKVVAEICCLTDFHTLVDEDGLDEQGIFYYVPDLLNHFSTADINKLIVPRPHLSIAGIKDPLTPVKGLDAIEQELNRAYSEFGASDAWKLLRYDIGHVETPEMRAEVLRFFDKWL